jgi:hypothetical protein
LDCGSGFEKEEWELWRKDWVWISSDFIRYFFSTAKKRINAQTSGREPIESHLDRSIEEIDWMQAVEDITYGGVRWIAQ